MTFDHFAISALKNAMHSEFFHVDFGRSCNLTSKGF
jgi:hypothetical protein